MKCIQVTTAFSRHDDEHDFDDLAELVDITGYEVDEETNEDAFLFAAEDEEKPPYIYQDPHDEALRWCRKRSTAVEAITEEGDDDGDDCDEFEANDD